MSKSLLAVPLAVALVAPVAAEAAPKPQPGDNTVTVAATPDTVLFGRTASIGGQVTGTGNGGVAVTLEEDPFPFDAFSRGPGATTDAMGNYAFTVAPALNTKYRVEAKAKPPVTSPEVLVKVRPRVSLRVSDRTPAQGTRVRFSGFVSPAHDGRVVAVQRLSPTGTFVTVARPRLADAGDARSRYSRRLRVTEDGTYRVRIVRHDDHEAGFSPRRVINVQ